jgi:hypothetical protein
MSPELAEHWHHLELEYWRGFIRGAEIFGPEDDPPSPAVVAALYADPHACLLRTLSLGPNVELFAHAASERIRELELSASAGAALELDAWFPRLEALVLFCDDAPEELAHPRLARLDVYRTCPALGPGRFALPALTTLDVSEEEGDVRALFERGAILHSPPPLLASLAISPWTPESAAALRESPLLPQLRSLTCRVDEAILDQMPADRFGHLDIVATSRVATREQRNALVARCARVLPRLKLDVSDDEWHRPPPAPTPPVALKLAGALSQIAERLRRRGT